NITGPVTVATLINDDHIGPMLLDADRSGLARTFPKRDAAVNTAENLHYNIATLEAAGVPILAGTDAPNPGTTQGASMHHELELLVSAGLTNQQALAAATSRAADSFGLDDRGRIEPGKRADLMLVNGNPLADIKATRDIVGVWKAGHAIDRETRRQKVAAAQEENDTDDSDQPDRD
ncbi:MAG: amidohydrolase family protein, partial [Pirellulaceae bacterium]